MHPRRRQAQTTSRTSASTPTTTRSSRCSATGPSATTSSRTRSPGAGNCSPRSGASRRSASSRPSTNLARANLQNSTRKPTISGRRFLRGRPRSQGPHRLRQQEGYFWMMGDTGPAARAPKSTSTCCPLTTRPPAASSSTRARPAASRSGTTFSSSSTRTPTAPSPRSPPSTSTTGLGFERVAGIHATTKGFKDFSKDPSNYNADVFKPTFDQIAALSGRKYTGTVPQERTGLKEQEQVDIAFRVLADPRPLCLVRHRRRHPARQRGPQLRHPPHSPPRHHVWPQILNLKIGDFTSLVESVVQSLGDVFPELKTQRAMIERAVRAEEESFGRTLDKGLQIFTKAAADGEISGEAPSNSMTPTASRST